MHRLNCPRGRWREWRLLNAEGMRFDIMGFLRRQDCGKNGETTIMNRAVFSLDCCDREVIRWGITTGNISSVMVQDRRKESLVKRFNSSPSGRMADR